MFLRQIGQVPAGRVNDDRKSKVVGEGLHSCVGDGQVITTSADHSSQQRQPAVEINTWQITILSIHSDIGSYLQLGDARTDTGDEIGARAAATDYRYGDTFPTQQVRAVREKFQRSISLFSALFNVFCEYGMSLISQA